MIKLELKEKDLIQIVIDKGLDLSQTLNSKAYQERGYIKNKDSLSSFMKTVLQVFESVELKLNPNSKRDKDGNLRPYAGKNRIYIVGKEREEIAEREDNRVNNGYRTSQTEFLLKELVWSSLGSVDSQKNIYDWVNFIGLNRIGTINKAMQKEIGIYGDLIQKIINSYELGGGEYFYFNPYFILNNFIENYNRHLNRVVKRILKKLAEEKKIELEAVYIGVNSEENSKKEITLKEVEKFKELKKVLLKEANIDEKKFNRDMFIFRSRSSDNVESEESKKLIETIKYLDSNSILALGFDKYKEEFRIKVVQKSKLTHLKEINEVFEQVFAEYSYKFHYEMARKDQKESIDFVRRFRFYNNMVILGRADLVNKEEFVNELSSYLEEMQDFLNKDITMAFGKEYCYFTKQRDILDISIKKNEEALSELFKKSIFKFLLEEYENNLNKIVDIKDKLMYNGYTVKNIN